MDCIVNVQRDLHKSIEKAFVNYKKSPKDRVTIEYLETRLENLERDWQLFRKNNTKLYETQKSEDIQASIYITDDLYDKTEDAYISYKSVLKVEINKLTAAAKIPSVQSSSENSSFVKLPKISIPIFSGKYTEWQTFRDLFVSLVHNNKTLDSVQKLHYLKGHLTGEAEQLIRHTPITQANYSQCWEQLEKRYNNKRYLANCVLKRLFSQRRLSFETSSGLKELLDNTSDCLNALKNLGVNVATWDLIIIHIVTFKLDPETRKQWELSISSCDANDLPTLDQFRVFIENRFRALECIDSKKSPSHNFNTKSLLATSTNQTMRCEFCSDGHKLCFCKKFSNQTVEQRREFVSKNKMCFNCLGSNHTVYDCKKPTFCKVCHKRHHSLLHLQYTNPIKDQPTLQKDDPQASSSDNSSHIVTCLSTGKISKPKQVLLATTLINVQSRSGDYQVVRALLDQGSQACFITEDAVQLLRLKKNPVHGVVSGLGESKSIVTKSTVNVIIQSRYDHNFKIPIKMFVLNNITSYLPEKNIDSFEWIDLAHLNLADPQFNTPNKIDILLGAEVYSQILNNGILKGPNNHLVAQSTKLGWILSGVVSSTENSTSHRSKNITVLHTQVTEDDQLKRFWEIEDQITSTKRLFSNDEQKCEGLYKTTTKRTKEGRYIVKLPFKDDVPSCEDSNSREVALKRFNLLEKKFERDQELKQKYKEVIEEYLLLNHMRPIKENDIKKGVYIPHHAVLRNDKTTTKVRVVVDASCKYNNGLSLNDTLIVGPTLQPELRHIILKWRTFGIGIVSDIVKMYRQVRIAEEDVSFQRIVWRNNPEDIITEYEFLTVLFGTASAPYLAVKTLNQVAIDEGKDYPAAAEIVVKSFYMDDLMTGSHTVEEGIKLCKQMKDLLTKGGFELQKWNSNSLELLKEINKYELVNQEKGKKEKTKQEREEEVAKAETNEDKETGKKKDKIENMEIKIDSTIKILGLTWDRSKDVFQYLVKLPEISKSATKRSILSDIAKLFDPLGWLAPTVIVAKIFIQKLWLAGLDWDQELPENLLNEWDTYRQQLPRLTEVRIPRWLGTKNNDILVELHGFSDASKVAYAAVIYLRRVDTHGNVHVSLLTAKTRVAPIKQVSIPRLELCAAVLLTRLLVETMEVLNIPKQNVKAWTDSTVVLAWLNSHPSRWKTFVGNRVSEILTSLDSSQWFHVSTKDNPADSASRGISPLALAEHKVWIDGPQFLRNKNVIYTKPTTLEVHLEESVKSHIAIASDDLLLQRFSKLQRLLRVVAYCRRFLKYKRDTNKFTSYLQKNEICESLECCIKISQREEFEQEQKELKQLGFVKIKTSKLKSLGPFLDKAGIIRVGGRLQNSNLDEKVKHPIVLSSKSPLSKLVVAEAHNRTLHGGQQLMLNYLRTNGYWVIRAKDITRQHVRKCITCIRQTGRTKDQMMGSLPSVRCKPARAFLHSGLDYAGPINVRTTKGRGHHAYKGYICLFVCMVTRAIHLEVVSDMTTECFLAAFRRFVGRRGHCARIYSDNGTTFVGAAKEIEQLHSLQMSAAEHLETRGTEWHFIPPQAPNFGGLWEAGVKSVKHHLKRIIGETTLTYEELSTLLIQIEACLNSRPISIINPEDPGACIPLTPSHFLIGESLLAVPEVDFINVNISSLKRWQMIQKMLQQFWSRWSDEYLSGLLQRYKWTLQTDEPKVGDLVLVKENNLPPSRWLLGRILEKHPGHDNITRVVTLRTKTSTIKRPTSKLCILPVTE